jgi:hypothetical protein
MTSTVYAAGIRAAAATAAIVLVAGCSSPTELDTPRTKRYLDSAATARVQASNVTVAVRGGMMQTPYTGALVSPVTVDTSRPGSAAVWINARITAPAGTEATLPLRMLEINTDSLVADSAPRDIVHGTPATALARYTIDAGTGTLLVDTADGTSTRIILQLSDDRAAHRIDGTITVIASVFGRQMQIDGTIAITY